ncbi:galanin receptor type 1-like [Phyllopteryx taeniolatus]|uniref:galanin receptor type 1-like n=1 Tax=Phyllopteryx taeniolatus TaxID=161469 RepID=UPI002AD41345|nr:galanin receptor type 1-like [Phyllopteryx taeniolatus]
MPQPANESWGPDRPGLEAVAVPAVFGLIFAVGLVGNALVVLVSCQAGASVRRRTAAAGVRRGSNPTDVFILNLSLADLLLLLLCVPLHASVYSLSGWPFGGFACTSGHFLASVSVLVSILTLVVLSADRYVAVVLSGRCRYRTRSAALLCVGLIWTLALACSVPVAQNHVLTGHPGAPNLTFCWEVWRSGRARRAYKAAAVVLGFLLPLVLICCSYVTVLFHLHKKMKNISQKSERVKRKTTQTVFLVIAAFLICWIPHHVIIMWAEFGRFPLTDASFVFRIASHCLSYGHACVNPVLYAFLSHKFRRSCCQLLACSRPGASPPGGSQVRLRMDNLPSTPSTTNI